MDLPLGDLCPACRREIERRAARLARLVAMVTTVAVAAYVMLKMPREPDARLVGAVAIVIWYILTNLVARRVLREFLR